MNEYRLWVMGRPDGPPTHSRVPSILERASNTTHDVYLCGHCGIVVARGMGPPYLSSCSNCGALNASRPDGATSVDHAPQAQPIVVIEDEPDVRDVIKEALALDGHRVICLENAFDLEQLDPDDDPAMFLVDIMLPGLDGIQLAEGLQSSQYPRTPMVAMSASRSHLFAAEQSHLFADTISKPFDLSTLLETVHQYAT